MAGTRVVGEDDIGPIFAGDDEPTTGEGAALSGMSLRDWFAGKVLAGLCANPGGPFQRSELSGWSMVNCTPEILANECFRIADAMLREHDRGREIKDLFAVDHGLDWYSVVPTEKEAMELESTERSGPTPDKIVRVQIKVLGDS